MPFQFFILFSLFGFSCAAQQTVFRNPLSGELLLSGNFGEVRGNHFHSGLDMKTGGVTGRTVYAVADGYVSRIAVSPTGFGKVLYINHPNGKTSVYAHLNRFSEKIAAYVKAQQYAKQKFKVDLQIPTGKFSVTSGDVIAFSGNSGGSGGPHLHFEIRETNGQIPENPLNYGFKVKDTRHPELQKLWVYVHSESGHVEDLITEKGFALNGNAGNYKLKPGDTVRASGILSLGIGALDRFSNSRNVCGIYSMEAKVNGEIIHQQKMDRFPFSKKRMVNCHVDYAKRKTDKQAVYRTYIAPHNKLHLYPIIKDSGKLNVEIGKTYSVEMEIADHAGNISKLDFTIIGQNRTATSLEPEEKVTDLFYPNQDNSFSNNSLRVNIPKGCLYDTLKFRYEMKPAYKNCISPVHSIGKLTDTPLDKFMTVSLKLNEVSESAMQKAVVVSFSSNGKPIAEGGKVKWNWITTRTRSFGDYTVMLDSLAPELRPKNFKDRTSTAGINTLKFHFDDDLSGIGSYSATLNGKWVLMEHDPKNNLLYYVKDKRFLSGQNTIQITAKDKVGNVKSLRVRVGF